MGLKLTAGKDSLAVAAPLAIAFAKHLGPIYLPPVSAATGTASDAHDFPTLAQAAEGEAEDAIVTRETKDKFRKLLLAYLDALGRREAKEHIVRLRAFLWNYARKDDTDGEFGELGTSKARQKEPRGVHS